MLRPLTAVVAVDCGSTEASLVVDDMVNSSRRTGARGRRIGLEVILDQSGECEVDNISTGRDAG
jgi:hypothetical protein